MTTTLSPDEARSVISKQLPGAVSGTAGNGIIINREALLTTALFLRDTGSLAFDYLNYITAVDYYDYFELVYQVTSLAHNRSLVFKVRCGDRLAPSVPSVTQVWRGADFQEREIYDLMGIIFTGHPNLKRIALWEGFEGHPLRKDFGLDPAPASDDTGCGGETAK